MHILRNRVNTLAEFLVIEEIAELREGTNRMSYI